MNMAAVLRVFGPATTLLVIRAQVAEQYRSQPDATPTDPWGETMAYPIITSGATLTVGTLNGGTEHDQRTR